MPDHEKSLVQRVLYRVRWAKHNKLKAEVRMEYLLVKEQRIAVEIGKVLKMMD